MDELVRKIEDSNRPIAQRSPENQVYPESASDASRGVSSVVPVYNSEGTVKMLVERLTSVLSPEGIRHEIILVNDGSRDKSWETIVEMTRQRQNVVGIDLSRNYGQHNALLAGIREAHLDVVVTIDDDLQNPPEEIPRLLAKLAEGYDVIYGTPESEQHGVLRDLASQITKIALQSSMGIETARRASAFRVFRTRLRDAFAVYQGPYVSIDVLLTWGTTRFAVVVVRHDARTIGVSNYTIRKLVTHGLNMITGFSTLPLQLASIVGFAFTLFGVVILAWVIGAFLIYGGTVPGFAFLASVIAIFSGAQLFALGIIGEYLARIHFRMMERPAYVIRKSTQSDARVE